MLINDAYLMLSLKHSMHLVDECGHAEKSYFNKKSKQNYVMTEIDRKHDSRENTFFSKFDMFE